MLDYGETYLELNERAIEQLTQIMTPALAEVALEMAPLQVDEAVEDEPELELA